MANPWFNSAVALFWLATMTWLAVAKVIPPLVVGEPPTYRSIVTRPSEERVAWSVHFNDRPVGSATTHNVRTEDDVTEMHSQVQFTRLPFSEMTPFRLDNFFDSSDRIDSLPLSAQSVVEIDPMGRLIAFRATVGFGHWKDAIRIEGLADGSELRLNVRSGNFRYAASTYLAPDALLGDALSPSAFLPNLRVGQTWTVPVFSPFHPPNSPMEILRATVEREELLIHDGAAVRAWLVVYRSDEGSGRSFSKNARGKLWVRRDGTVLKQETTLSGGRVQFVRESNRT